MQALQAQRDALNVEWGQLLLEEGAWSQHRRVELLARTRIGMSVPGSAQRRRGAPERGAGTVSRRQGFSAASGAHGAGAGAVPGAGGARRAALHLQVLDAHFLQDQGQARHSRVVKDNSHRGMLLDRNGAPLAVSTPVDSVWAHPPTLAEAGQRCRRSRARSA